MRTSDSIDDATLIAYVEEAAESMFQLEAEFLAGKVPNVPGREMPIAERRRHVAGITAAAMLRAGIAGVPRLERRGPYTIIGDVEIFGGVWADEMAAQYGKDTPWPDTEELGEWEYFNSVGHLLGEALLRPQAVAAFKRWRGTRRAATGRHAAYGRLVAQLQNLQAYARGETQPPHPYP